MREFLDKNTGITWVTPEVSKIEFNTPMFIQSDQRVLDEFTNELNENDCDDAGISEFVTGGDIRLGSFISWALDKFSRPFYAFDDGRLVGTAVINGHSDLDTIALEHFIDYLEANKRSLPDGMAGYLSHKRANKILASADDENNTDINYIIVIPKAQGRGVGTRMLASIKANPQFFSHNPFTQTTSAIVHKNNVPSQTIFRRNDFANYTLDLKNGKTNFHDFVCETPTTMVSVEDKTI